MQIWILWVFVNGAVYTHTFPDFVSCLANQQALNTLASIRGPAVPIQAAVCLPGNEAALHQQEQRTR